MTIKYTVPSQGEVNTEQRLLWDVKYSSKGNSKETSHVFSGIRINEIVFFPAETESEWVELYNESDGQINIAGYHICNALGNVYTIPDKFPPIPAGAFVVIVFDGEASSIDESICCREATPARTTADTLRIVYAMMMMKAVPVNLGISAPRVG